MAYNQYNQYGGNPYQDGPAQEGGYGYGNPYGQEQHELQPYGEEPQQPPPQQHSSVPVLSQQDFLSRVSHVRGDIRSLTEDVQQIAGLHQRALAGSDPSAAQQLDALVAGTQLKNTSIRDQLRSLQRDTERTTDTAAADLKRRHFGALQNDFKKEVQGYLQEEQAYRDRYRDQIARQVRIVNPDATDEEVRQAADENWGEEGGVFQTALRTNRTGQASAVLGAVRARHNELQKIEQAITELANLFQDLDTLVIQQEAVVDQADEQVQNVNQNLEDANKQVQIGINHARRARKLKWWCFGIVVLIVIILALGLGIGLSVSKSK